MTRKFIFMSLLLLAAAFQSCGSNATAPPADKKVQAPLPGIDPCVPCGNGRPVGEPTTTTATKSP